MAPRRRGVSLALLTFLLAGAACSSRPPHAVVVVRDPAQIAAGASSLSYGTELVALSSTPLSAPVFPLSFLLTAEQEGEQPLWVELAQGDGHIIARGKTLVRLTRLDGSGAEVVLGRPCNDDTECDDGVFCDGLERCSELSCAAGELPCGQGPFNCVELSCVEELRACATLVHHERCDPVDVGAGSEPTYCDASRGCLRGAPCALDGDCDNSMLCDGQEHCVGGRCVRGSPPMVDDAEPCTIDLCVEGSGRQNLADVAAEGRPCSDSTGSAGLCHSGHCLSSSCGDGLLDPRNEQCDDANDNPNDGCDRCSNVSWRAAVLTGLGRQSGDPLAASLPDPTDIAVDSRGLVYISDQSLLRVLRLDPVDQVVTSLVGGSVAPFLVLPDGLRASSQLPLFADLALAVDGADGLLVFSGNQIIRADLASGKSLFVVSDVGGTFGQVPYVPVGLAIDDGGAIYAARGSENCVTGIFPPSGATLPVAGACGSAGAYTGDGGPASAAQLSNPLGVATGPNVLYIADTGNHAIRRVASDGRISSVAGTGSSGFSGDGGPAALAQLASPRGVALDPLGRLLIADTLNHRIRRVERDGSIHTIAGTGSAGFSGDGGLASVARLRWPTRVVVDPIGNIYVLDAGNRRVRRIDASSDQIQTVLGTGRADHPAEGQASDQSQLARMRGLDRGPSGELCFGDRSVLRCVSSSGSISTVYAADPSLGVISSVGFAPSGELHFGQGGRVYRLLGPVATPLPGLGAAAGEQVGDMLFDPGSPLLYTVDASRNVLRRLDLQSGLASVVAGSDGNPGFAGDGAAPAAALLRTPRSVARDSLGRLLIADAGNHVIRRVDLAANRIDTICGTGADGDTGDELLATAATLSNPSEVVARPDGSILVADRRNNRIRRIDPGGVIHAFAGHYVYPVADGDGGLALNAGMSVDRLALSPTGDLYLSEGLAEDHLRRIDGTSGIIDTVAGRLSPQGDGPLEDGLLVAPAEMVSATDGTGAPVLLVVDDGYLRAVDLAAGELRTLAGRRGGSFFAPMASATTLWHGSGVAFDPSAGLVYAIDHDFDLIRVYDMSAGSASLLQATGPHTTGGAPLIYRAHGMLADPARRRLLIADGGYRLVRSCDLSVTPAVCTILAGGGSIPAVDGVQALGVGMDEPTALALSTDGRLFIADRSAHKVFRVDPDGSIFHVLGDGQLTTSGDGGPARELSTLGPSGLAVDAHGNLFVSSSNGIQLVTAGADGVAGGDDRVITIYGRVPRDSFPETATVCLGGLALGAGPNGQADASLFVLDICTGLMLRLDREAQ